MPGILSWKRLFLIYTVPLILFIYGLTALGVFERPDLFLLDRAFQFRGSQAPGDEITIVAISQKDFQQGAPRWPWPRSLMARLVDQIARYQPSAIAIDILYTERSNSEAVITQEGFKEIQPYLYQVFSGVELEIQDAQGTHVIGPGSPAFDLLADSADSARRQDLELADAIQRANERGIGIVVAAGNISGGAVVGLSEPYDELTEAAGGSIGLVAVQTDTDGSLRRYIPYGQNKEGQLVYSLSLATVAKFRGVDLPARPLPNGNVPLGPDLMVEVDQGSFLVNYPGPPGTYPALTALQVLRGEEDLSDFLQGRMVFLGVSDPSAEDLYPTPFSGKARMAGVEVHAAAAGTILDSKYIVRAPAYQGIILLTVLGLVSVALGRFPRPAYGVAGQLAVLAGLTGLWLGLFSQANYFLPVSASLTATILAYGLALSDRAGVERLEKQRTQATFSRYVDPGFVKELLSNPDSGQLGGKRTGLTVLFSDIRGFTAMSSMIPSEAVVEFLNSYLTAMTEVVFQYEGTVDKFQGDGVMAFFGAPQSHDDDPQRAVLTALAMRDRLATLQDQWQDMTGVPLRIGIGIDTGQAVVGNIGSPTRMDYTVIGDVVNLASRLQDMTQRFGANILISGNTYSKVKDMGEFRHIGRTEVQGRPLEVDLYEPINLKPIPIPRGRC